MATFKRADFLAETLDSIVSQLPADVELVVVDGASPDNTPEVMQRYVVDHPNVRYYREPKNSGVDGDYDKAVEYARGEYCWLVADDDLLVPGAVDRVLDNIGQGSIELLVVDSEVRDVTLTRVLQSRRLRVDAARTYSAADADQFLADAGDALTFIGCVVIRRDIWMSRDRRSYHGTAFIHVGVIFQLPHLDRIRVLPEALVIIRLGNAMWTSKAFEVWMFKWPNLIWSFDGYSDEAKRGVAARRPYLGMRYLLMYRANGAYGLQEYRSYLRQENLGRLRLPLLMAAIAPGRMINFLGLCYLMLRGKAGGAEGYVLLRSRYSNWATRSLAKMASSR